MATKVISLGGSLIMPKEINVEFLRKFRELMLDYANKGNRAIIITGGGNVCREYQKSAQKIAEIDTIDLDWIGIAATKLNAELLRAVFGKDAYEKVVYNPTENIKTDKKIIIGSGWMPGCSSDKDAVLIAKNFNADTIINLSNIDYVYDKDPKKFRDAKPIKDISWKDFLKITGDKWTPGLNVPFDPEASKEAMKLKLKVIIIGTNIENLKNCLNGKGYIGTTIS